jgi:hypothetical protein
MAQLDKLPNEVLLEIFKSPALSFFDLLSISISCRKWRIITSIFKPLKERLFKRPSILPPFRQPGITSAHITINVQLRRTPATIWNEYADSTWQLYLSWDEDESSLPSPQCPVLAEVRDLILRPSNLFSCEPPYTGCGIHVPASTNGRPTLTFRNLKDLRRKIRQYEDSMVLSFLQNLLLWNLAQSWLAVFPKDKSPLPTLFRRGMLITQHPLTQLDVVYCCGVRYGAHNYGRDAIFTHRYNHNNGALLTLGGLEFAMHLALANVWCMFEEQNGDIVPGDDTQWGR